MTGEDPNRFFSVAGKVALITGGTSGIGRMMAEALAAAGAKVTVVARSADDCAATAKALDCRAIQADIASLDGIASLVRQFEEVEDHLDILVNNAGLFRVEQIEALTEGEWDEVQSINVKAPFFLVQRFLPLLRNAAKPEAPARIVNISSGHGLRISSLESFSYQASKAGLIHLTRGLAKRLAGEAITVNSIAPGVFPSRLTEKLDEAQIAKGVPLGRYGQAAEIAGTLIYLCSRAGAYTTGTVIPVDGGTTACG